MANVLAVPSSGGCNPINWLSQTRRNRTIEFCNYTKINTVAFILYGKGFCFLRLAHFCFASAYASKTLRYRYYAAYRFEFKVFNQIGTRRYFSPVKKKKCFAQENAKKVVEGLGTDLFVTVTNVTPYSCDCREILLGKFFLITSGFDATCKRSEKTFSVPRYNVQHNYNTMKIFDAIWYVVSDISKVLLNDKDQRWKEALEIFRRGF